MLKKWLNIIGLPFWKPLKTNRICSDHFESYYIMKIDNVYQLNKYAVPSIKPKVCIHGAFAVLSLKYMLYINIYFVELICLQPHRL